MLSIPSKFYDFTKKKIKNFLFNGTNIHYKIYFTEYLLPQFKMYNTEGLWL